MAQEWLRLRYGVFEERGFPGDLLYPDSFYNALDNDTVSPTICSDTEKVQFAWLDK